MIKQSILSLLAVGGACASPSDTELGETTQNGVSFNGVSLNGVSLNGVSLNGVSLNGVSLNGVSLNGTSLTGVALKAGLPNGPPLSGPGVVGSTWTGTATDGTTVKLRIDRSLAGTAPNTDLWFYGLSYQTTAGWQPLCGLDATNQPILAVSVAGVWGTSGLDTAHYAASTTQFTLACRGKTIGKCVELGYKTYKGYTNQLTSCVRLLRGDFCGTGDAYTTNGNELNLYDNVGVQTDTQVWPVEAEWTPDGARCVNSNNDARYQLVLSKDPKCLKRSELPTCGASFASGAVLIDELSPTVTSTIDTLNSTPSPPTK
ncbi:MAG TPA: ADYC domain-containing protein [Kofleriaceae bacterium]|nr:ADYC domain-containing protein [Kofleriaceae bacterium]